MESLSKNLLSTLPAGVRIPGYLNANFATGIVHFGVGNFHRSHQAMYVDRLLEMGIAQDWAICGVGLLERDALMRDALLGQDGLYTLTLRKPDGAEDVAVIGALREFLYAPDDPATLFTRLSSPETKIVSLTVTEGGYVCDPTTGRDPKSDPLVCEEVANGLSLPRTAFGWIVAALRERRAKGVAPFAVLSCDNIQGNGRVARLSVEGVARLIDADLADWITAEVAFPSTMVDRITPATTTADIDRIESVLGVHDAWPVTSEPFTQWIIEDHFPHGRPPFEKVGAIMVSDIDPYEAIKLRLLNGAHQALAYIGQLCGYEYVHEAISDCRIEKYIRSYLEIEAAPTLVAPDGFDIPAYIEEIFIRFGNPYVRDLLSRLSVDASNRIPKFLAPVFIDRVRAGHTIALGASVLATWRAWCRACAIGHFTMDDCLSAQLIAAASHEPREFLNCVPGFTSLLASPDFVEAFTTAAELLEQEGPAGLLTVFEKQD